MTPVERIEHPAGYDLTNSLRLEVLVGTGLPPRVRRRGVCLDQLGDRASDLVGLRRVQLDIHGI